MRARHQSQRAVLLLMGGDAHMACGREDREEEEEEAGQGRCVCVVQVDGVLKLCPQMRCGQAGRPIIRLGSKTWQ